MSTSTLSLPIGTLASDLTWNDDLAHVHQRMAYHEGRLGLPARQTDDIAAANHYLYRVAASPTKAEAEQALRTLTFTSTPELASDVAAEAAREAEQATPAKSYATTPPASGYQRLARAFAGSQPSQVRAVSSTPQTSAPAPSAPTQTGPTGVARIAAAYARAAKTPSTTN